MKHLRHDAPSGLDRVTGQRAVMLTTFRRSGVGVPTPVGYGTERDALFFMTNSTAGKVKRLRRDPRVLVAASTLRGDVRGPAVEGRATELSGADAEHAMSLITSHNRLAWFFLLRKARREGRVWSVYRIDLDPGHLPEEGFVKESVNSARRSAEPTTTSGTAADAGRSGSPARAAGHGKGVASILLFAFALGQFVSALCSSLFGGAFTTADRAGEPSIVPLGYAFSIWGLIETLSLAYAIWALWRRNRLVKAEPSAEGDREIALIDRIAVPFAVVTAGFSAWLVAAELEPTWSTLAVFAVMIVALLTTMKRALAGSAVIAQWPVLGRVLLWWSLGLYTGWSSIAIWLNLTTGLVNSGAPITGTAGVLGQLAILAGASATAAAILHWTRGLLPYAAAVLWALIGAVLGAYGAGEPGLALAAAVGAGIVAVVTVVEQLRRPREDRSLVSPVPQPA